MVVDHDAYFKYDSSLCKVPDQKYPNNAFLIPNLRIFIFVPKFAISQIRRH